LIYAGENNTYYLVQDKSSYNLETTAEVNGILYECKTTGTPCEEIEATNIGYYVNSVSDAYYCDKTNCIKLPALAVCDENSISKLGVNGSGDLVVCLNYNAEVISAKLEESEKDWLVKYENVNNKFKLSGGKTYGIILVKAKSVTVHAECKSILRNYNINIYFFALILIIRKIFY